MARVLFSVLFKEKLGCLMATSEVVTVTSWGVGIVTLFHGLKLPLQCKSKKQPNNTINGRVSNAHAILSFPTKINNHQTFPGVFRPFFLLKHLHAIRTPWTCKCFVLPPSHCADPSQNVNFSCAPRFKGNSPWLSPQTDAAGHRTSN